MRPYFYPAWRPARGAACEKRVAYGTAPRPDTLSEALLQAAWRRAGGRRLTVSARDGRSYRVLYPGRPGPGRGPDFLDAVLERDDGAVLTGDIEVHVRPSGWREHGHGADGRYNGVVFHVASTGTGPDVTSLARVTVPLLVFGASDAAAGPVSDGGMAGGVTGPEHRDAVAVIETPEAPRPMPAPIPFFDLAAAGDQRFLAKSSGFELDIRQHGPDQALYAGVLECLGFPRNRGPFRKLARRLPWDRLISGLAPETDGAGRIQARLMWAAGFGTKPDGETPLAGTPPEWDLPGGRPDNHPQRRTAGAAELAARWSAAGGPITSTRGLVESPGGTDALSQALTAGSSAGRRAVVGGGRASELAVNAVLPCLHALACLRGEEPLAQRCLDLFRTWPRLPENAITREAKALLASCGLRPVIRGAREQQGLHLLYRAMTSPVVRPAQMPLL